MEQQLNQLTFQEVTLRKELSSFGEAVNIYALEDWEPRSCYALSQDMSNGFDEIL